MTDGQRFSRHQIDINEDWVAKDGISAAMHCSKCTKNMTIAAKKKDSLSFWNWRAHLINKGVLTWEGRVDFSEITDEQCSINDSKWFASWTDPAKSRFWGLKGSAVKGHSYRNPPILSEIIICSSLVFWLFRMWWQDSKTHHVDLLWHESKTRRHWKLAQFLLWREKCITKQEVSWGRIIEASLPSSCVLIKTFFICLHSLFHKKEILQRDQRKHA